MKYQKSLSVLLALSLIPSSPAALAQETKAAMPVFSAHNQRRIPMSKLLKRSEVPAEHTWKLEDLYADQKAWDQEYEEVSSMMKKASEFQGKLNQPDVLKASFEFEDEIGLKLERLFVYARMHQDEDTANPTYQSLSQKAQKLGVRVGEALSFVTPEILSLPDSELDALIKNESLSAYTFTLEEMKREKAHVLSQAEEALLAQVGNLSQAPQTIFSMLNNADLKFPRIKDENGKEVELTHGSYIQFLENPNREVRERAFKAVYETYAKQKNTIAAALNANVTKNMFYANVRKYPSVMEMNLYGDNIPTDVYNNLVDTIHESLPLLHRYMDLRKKLLGVDQLHMYDLFAPLVDEYKMDITYEEAKKTVKEGLAPLGKEYAEALQAGYDNRWIDVYENENKRSGAYAWGAYGTHPYVLLNHKDNLNSMFTLAHEMGHALHSHYSDTTLSYRDAQYTIFLAEVASTTNEALLMDYMLNKSTDPKEKLYLLTYYADQFRTTVFRQTMFAEFEKIIHERAEQGEALTPQLLSEIYYDLNVQYHGKNMVVDKDIEMEWARIPHFYNSFYVYKYATGFSAATSFSKQILEEGQPAVDRYLGFLKSGGSDYSINILKKAGVDMSTPQPIREAMSVFKELIEQMEQLTK
ncbi:oligoendopeptidase F [Paenibacillus intestini]|nr:oligoendopeptidase F [Paenibacillus intestini]